MIRPGVVLSQPPMQHRAVDRMRAQKLLHLHGQQVAIEHRGRLHRWFRRARSPGFRRESRRPARRRASPPRRASRRCAWQGLRSLQVLRMPIIGLPAKSSLVIAHLHSARAMAETAHVTRAEPAIGAQLFRFLVFHGCFIAPLPRTVRNFSANCATAKGFDKSCVPGSSTPL